MKKSIASVFFTSFVISIILSTILILPSCSIPQSSHAEIRLSEEPSPLSYRMLVEIQYPPIIFASISRNVFVTQDRLNVWDANDCIYTLRQMDGTPLLSGTDIWLWKDATAVRDRHGWGLFDLNQTECIPCKYEALGYLTERYTMAFSGETEKNASGITFYQHRYLIDRTDGRIVDDIGPGGSTATTGWLTVMLPDGNEAQVLLRYGNYIAGSDLRVNATNLKYDDTTGMIKDKTGRILWGGTEQCTILCDGAYFLTESYGKCAVYDSDGRVVIPVGAYHHLNYNHMQNKVSSTFPNFMLPCDDSRLLIVEQYGKNGIIVLP